MRKRPLSVTLIAWLFIATGILGLAYHANEINPRHLLDADLLLASFVRLLAIVAGIFMLRGDNWARWLAVAWLAFHVGLSAFHPLPELLMHTVLLIVLTYFLFRPHATAFFRQPQPGQTAN